MHTQYNTVLLCVVGLFCGSGSKSDSMRVRRLAQRAQGEGRGEPAWDPLVNERSVRPQTF